MKKILLRHLCITAFIFTSYSTMAAFSKYPVPADWATNGTVRDIEVYEDNVYFAGDFTYVGSLTGGGAAFATDTGKVNTSFPTISGHVHAVIPDSNGGFYIGGDFSAAGYDTRENIAHILSDGTLDSDFNVEVNGVVKAIVLSTDATTLYFGGEFTTVFGTARKRLAAVTLDTCTLTEWAPEANHSVRALAISPDGTIVYAGGLFTSMDSTTRNRIAALDSDDGSLQPWNPSADNNVYVIQVSSDGSAIYVGGDFTTIAGESRKYLAAINTDGTASSFDPSPNSTVSQIIISQDGTILRIAGSFTDVLGTERKHIAFINTSDGGVTSWSPASVNAAVDSIAVSTDETTLYICGNFTTVSSLTRHYIASLNISDGALTNWNPSVESRVSVIAASSDGSKVYAGGDFALAGGAVRKRLAAIDVSSDTLLDWDPKANDLVYCLELSHDKSTIFAGGSFTTIGGITRNRIAQIGVLSGNVNSWNPSADGTVRSIQTSSEGNTIYAGGVFSNIGGSAKQYLAALSSSTGNATSWTPSPDNYIHCIRISPSDNTLYVGGDFTNIGEDRQKYITAISTETGLSKQWASTADATVYSLELTSDGQTLYAGGAFTSICGKTRSRIAAITLSTGTATAWNPVADDSVHALKLSTNENYIYVGGIFTSIAAAARNYAAYVSTSEATAASWNPKANAKTLAFAISKDDSTLFAGGVFTKIAGQKCQYLASFKSGEYHLTVTNGLGDGNYTSGTVVNIKADIPPPGHYFEKWTGNTSHLSDSSSTTPEATISTADITVEANFKPLTYTLTFTAGTNGAIKGTSTQTVSYGASTNSVTAVPDTDYRLENWTGTDGFESEDNPLKINNVSKDMDITANFAPAIPSASLTTSSSPEAGGTTDPSGTNDTIVDRPLTITATPTSGYHFFSWTGSDNADISDPYSSSTTATISADATITANFAITSPEALLTVDVSPAGAGETTPSGTTTVNTGEVIAITATPNEGFYFLAWTYSNGSVTVANSLSSTTTAIIYSDVTVTANFAEIPDETIVTTGKIYTLDATDVTGIANFAKSPQVHAQYTDSVSAKIKKAKLKNLTKIAKIPVETVSLEWSKKIPLLPSTLWKENKSDTTLEILASNPPSPLTGRIYVKAVDSDGIKTDKYVETTIDLYETQPEITGVYNEKKQRITAASAGQKLTIRGALFGKKKPKVWIEYKDKNSVVKKQNLKVDRKAFRFPDYKGTEAKYPMDIYTGESELSVYMPAKWSKTWTHVGDHNLVIDNGVCRATIQFSTLPKDEGDPTKKK